MYYAAKFERERKPDPSNWVITPSERSGYVLTPLPLYAEGRPYRLAEESQGEQ